MPRTRASRLSGCLARKASTLLAGGDVQRGHKILQQNRNLYTHSEPHRPSCRIEVEERAADLWAGTGQEPAGAWSRRSSPEPSLNGPVTTHNSSGLVHARLGATSRCPSQSPGCVRGRRCPPSGGVAGGAAWPPASRVAYQRLERHGGGTSRHAPRANTVGGKQRGSRLPRVVRLGCPPATL